MHTARANLAVTAHNMSNHETPGFSRQATVQSANPALNLRNGRGVYGMGSSVNSVIQIRDQFLDKRFWGQNSILGEFAVKVPQLSLVESVFNVLSGAGDEIQAGINAGFKDFFAAIQSLTGEAHSATFRTGVLQTGEALAGNIQSNALRLQQQQRDLNGEVRAVVTEINSLGRQIVTLNEQIRNLEFHGSRANDLRDQRALLIDRLSEFVNVTVEEHDFSEQTGINNDLRLTVSLDGYDFVNNLSTHPLSLIPREAPEPAPQFPRRNEMDVPGLYEIRFANGSRFDMYSPTLRGTLRGLIDLRDGNGGISTQGTLTTNNFRGIPFYQNRLNELVRTFADEINTLHRSGFNLQDANNPALDFFTWEYSRGTAAATQNSLTFSMNSVLQLNPSLLQASDTPGSGESNSAIIRRFVDLWNDVGMFNEGTLEDFLNGTSNFLAVDNHQAMRFRQNYHEMSHATQNQRAAVSGVSYVEELMDMQRFTALFNNNARMMQAINEIYDTLINRLGI